jgi:hypothetical protein
MLAGKAGAYLEALKQFGGLEKRQIKINNNFFVRMFERTNISQECLSVNWANAIKLFSRCFLWPML